MLITVCWFCHRCGLTRSVVSSNARAVVRNTHSFPVPLVLAQSGWQWELCDRFNHTGTWWVTNYYKLDTERCLTTSVDGCRTLWNLHLVGQRPLQSGYRNVSDNSVLLVQFMLLDKQQNSSKDDSYFHHQGNRRKQMKSRARNWKATALTYLRQSKTITYQVDAF